MLTRDLELDGERWRKGRRLSATGDWTAVAGDRRVFAFEHGCPVMVTRSEVGVPDGMRIHEVAWSATGMSLFVLAGRERATHLLVYRRPWSHPDRQPHATPLDELVLYLGPVAADGRWVVAYGERRLDGRSAGLLDRDSGRVHWIDDAVRVQGWTGA